MVLSGSGVTSAINIYQTLVLQSPYLTSILKALSFNLTK